MRLTHPRAVALMVAATLMWSIAGVVTRHLESAHGFEVTFWRSFFTLLSLLVILPLWQGSSVWRCFHRAPAALWVSGVCWSLMFTGFMLALTLTSVANVLLTMAVGPLLTALAARLLIGHHITVSTGLAMVGAGAGMAWMYGGQTNITPMAGMLAALLVPVAAAINWTTVQHAHARGQDVGLAPAILLGAALSGLITLPLALPLQASLHDIELLAMLGLVQLAIPCMLTVICARVLKAPEIALLGLLEVIFGISLAWLGADEVPPSSVLSGGALVVSALLFNEWSTWRLRR